MREPRFFDVLAAMALDVPEEFLRRAAEALDDLGDGAGSEAIVRALESVRPAAARDGLCELVRSHAAGFRAGEIATSFRAAAWTAARTRRAAPVELVWSGPVPDGLSPRTTEQALVEVIETAEKNLLVVAFAAYKVPLVRDALAAAVARGVRITLLAEWREAHRRRGSGDILGAVGRELADGLRLLQWPPESRPRSADGDPAALHAKCALADRRVALITSANLTGDALTINMEMGVLVRGGALPERIAAMFEGLETGGQLAPVSSFEVEDPRSRAAEGR